jgi:hypothetical protein
MTDTTTKVREHYSSTDLTDRIKLVYPVPWARDGSTSFLLSEGDTRTAIEQAGFKVALWRDDTQTALDWFKAAQR